MTGTNGNDMRHEIARARAAVEAKLGVPLLGQSPPPRAQVIITLQADGQVNCAWSQDEIMTRFLFSKGLAIFEQAVLAQVTPKAAPDGD